MLQIIYSKSAYTWLMVISTSWNILAVAIKIKGKPLISYGWITTSLAVKCYTASIFEVVRSSCSCEYWWRCFWNEKDPNVTCVNSIQGGCSNWRKLSQFCTDFSLFSSNWNTWSNHVLIILMHLFHFHLMYFHYMYILICLILQERMHTLWQLVNNNIEYAQLQAAALFFNTKQSCTIAVYSAISYYHSKVWCRVLNINNFFL